MVQMYETRILARLRVEGPIYPPERPNRKIGRCALFRLSDSHG